MAKKTYTVLREHFGDKEYLVGDERSAEDRDVAHLVGTVLEEKSEKKAENKAAPKSKNKSDK